ncbi:MAG: aldo/keto reductase [candidate division KSB1 bacterium]|nr:aldo/keto reductase [candidate division KSB1 bacterium]
MNRRQFLKSSAYAAGFAVTGCSLWRRQGRTLPKRPLGRTGERLSIVGLGGVVLDQMHPADARELISEVLDLGLNYFDVAPSYGNAEEVMGQALRGRREGVFLACKTLKRDAEGARQELERSLRLLQTDHFDLYQLHALSSAEDVEKIFGPKGAIEAFVKARDEGLIRYIGFSAHSVKAALLALDHFSFDTVLLPVNFVLFYVADFGPQVIKKAREKGTAVLAIKSLAFHRLAEGQERVRPKCWYVPLTDRALAAKALRFTLSQDVTAAIPPGDPELFRMAVDLAFDVQPLSRQEEEELRMLARGKEPLFQLDL